MLGYLWELGYDPVSAHRWWEVHHPVPHLLHFGKAVWVVCL